jgi:serine protease Do
VRTKLNVSRWRAIAATVGFLAAAQATPAVAQGQAAPAVAEGQATSALATPPETCDVTSVVAHAVPAIVNIWVAKLLPAGEAGDEPADDATDLPAGNTTDKSGGNYKVEFFVGTGFVVAPSGVIVTNKHVIQNAAMIRVTFHDGVQVPAQLIAASSLIDFAMLKVNVGHSLPVLHFADSDRAQLGQRVIAIGNPLGLGTSVSTGVISGVGRNLMKTPIDEFIQTDASINPGNSGGPLLECNGKVIGVDTALLSNSKVLGSIGIGFALPSNDVALDTMKLMNPAIVHPNWVGLELQDLTPGLAESFGDQATHGAIVTRVDPGSPAAKAGLAPGDVIAMIDRAPATNARFVQRTIVVTPTGEPITLSVWHAGQTRNVSVRGADWPHMAALRGSVLASATAVASVHAEGTGMHVVDITPALRKRFDLQQTSGVVIDHVADGTEADSLGLTAGDVITMVGDQPAASVAVVDEHLDHAAAAKGYLVPLLVASKSKTWWVTVYVCHVNIADLLAPEPHEPVVASALRTVPSSAAAPTASVTATPAAAAAVNAAARQK